MPYQMNDCPNHKIMHNTTYGIGFNYISKIFTYIVEDYIFDVISYIFFYIYDKRKCLYRKIMAGKIFF